MNIETLWNGLGEHIIGFLTEADGSLVFCSLSFLATFIVFFTVYLALTPARRWLQTAYVVAFSLFFAYKSNSILMILLPATTILSWWLTRNIRQSKDYTLRRAWLLLVIVTDLLPLLYFKYANSFLSICNDLIGTNFSLLSIILPIGISFYTFQAISYSVDVYSKRFTEEVSLLDYAFFLSFFPLLFAGPITRAETLIPQLKPARRKISQQLVYTGLWLIIIGLLKKGLVADYVAQYNNWIFDDPTGFSGFEVAVGILGYAMQIYLDFSGYSDLSIGLAAIMGFRLLDNFDFPYRSLNLSEFWHRWHISLSTWVRDYIYIPLGGNRVGTFRKYLNNFIVMIVVGWWHGATWMFIIWGAMHGAGLVLHKAMKRWLDRIPDTLPIRFLSWLLTFLFVIVAWVFFRADSVDTAIDILRRSVTDFRGDYLMPFIETRPTLTLFIALGYALLFVGPHTYHRLRRLFVLTPWLVKAVLFIITVQLLLHFSNGSIQPFIYSQF